MQPRNRETVFAILGRESIHIVKGFRADICGRGNPAPTIQSIGFARRTEDLVSQEQVFPPENEILHTTGVQNDSSWRGAYTPFVII